MTVADLDNDSDLDIVAGYPPWDSNGGVRPLLSNGDGTFERGRLYRLGSAWKKMDAADFNGDGYVDLVGARPDSGVFVILNKGVSEDSSWSGFDRPIRFGISAPPQDVAAADFDGDGAVDLVVGHSEFVPVLRNQGTIDGEWQGFGERKDYTAGSHSSSVTVGDVNGDGDEDLVIGNYFSGNISILMGNGDGTFQEAANYPAGSRAESVELADFDGDGDLDVATAVFGTRDVSVLLNHGDGTFADGVRFGVRGTIQSLSVGDLDGDGDFDIVTAPYSGNQLWILLNDGAGQFEEAESSLRGGRRPYRTFVADLNGDGLDDVLVANADSGSISVFYNEAVTEQPIAGDANHDGVFNSTDLITVLAAGEYEDAIPNNSSFEEGDWNGDGDFTTSDLIFALQQGNYSAAAILAASSIIEPIERGKLFAGDPDVGDQFGRSSAMTNDGKVAVFGASKDDSASRDAGAAYVFYNGSSGWVQVAKLTSAAPARSDEIGESVAIAGDKNGFTIVVGSIGTKSAYVYEGSINFDAYSGSSVPTRVLQATGNSSSVSFGARNAVSISRHAGGETIVIGDPRDSRAGRTAGAAFVFEQPASGWSGIGVLNPTTTLLSDTPSKRELFGWSTSISGDGTTIAVGSNGSGEFQLFRRDSTSVPFIQGNHQATILSEGATIGWDGDLSQDGSVLVASAMWNVFVTREPAGGWGNADGTILGSNDQLPRFLADPNTTGVRYGWTVDINDAGDTILVGTASNSESTAFAYTMTSSINEVHGFGQYARFAPTGTTDGNLSAAATNGTVALFGNSFDDAEGTPISADDVGAVHVFDIAPPTPVPGISVLVPVGGIVTSEAGDSQSFDIVLDTQPTADVTVTIDPSSIDLTEHTVAPTSVTFTATNWNVPQSITVTGVSDGVDDGDVAYTLIVQPATSLDPVYGGIDPNDVAVSNLDVNGPSSPTMHVAAMSGTGESTRGNKWNVTVYVTVQDEIDSPVEGVSVSGTWTNGVTGSSTCTTLADGQCSVVRQNIKSNVAAVTFVVDSLVHAVNLYDPTMDSPNPPVLTVAKPGTAAVAAAIADMEADMEFGVEAEHGDRLKVKKWIETNELQSGKVDVALVERDLLPSLV